MKSAVGQISLTPSAVARTLGGAAALIILASIAGQISRFAFGHDYLKGLVPLFDVDREQNIPNYFSVLLMHLAALLLAGIAISAKAAGSSRAAKWALLSVGFVDVFARRPTLACCWSFSGARRFGVFWLAIASLRVRG